VIILGKTSVGKSYLAQALVIADDCLGAVGSRLYVLYRELWCRTNGHALKARSLWGGAPMSPICDPAATR